MNKLYFLAEAKAFGDVKLGELPGWLASRNKTPAGVGRAMGLGREVTARHHLSQSALEEMPERQPG